MESSIWKSGTLTLSITEELSLIKTSPLDRARIIYQSEFTQSYKTEVQLKPGNKAYSKTVKLNDIEKSFAPAKQEIMAGTRTSYPKWQLKLIFEKDGQILETRTVYLSAPEKWFWSFENPV